MGEKLKVLNLYAGIGGNRKLWEDVEVTAVELNPEIAAIYQDFFPQDKVIIADAHQYLLEHYKEYDFIWSSPPCPTHSDIRRCAVHRGQNKALYPDMALYQEIILCDNFIPINSKYVVENVQPYYEPLIKESIRLHRHLFWNNFYVNNIKFTDLRKHEHITDNSIIYGFDLNKCKFDNKRKILRNMVMPEVGLHFLNCARNIITKQNIHQTELWTISEQ